MPLAMTLQEHVAGPDVGERLLLDADVGVAVVHPYLHAPLSSR